MRCRNSLRLHAFTVLMLAANASASDHDLQQWTTLRLEHEFFDGLTAGVRARVRFDDDVSVLYGRCLHRGALMSDGSVDGHNLICGVHGWDYRVDTGVSEYNNAEALRKFDAWVEDDAVWVDEREVAERLFQQPGADFLLSYRGRSIPPKVARR